MKQITPLSPEEEKPEPGSLIPDSLIEPTAPEPEASEQFDAPPEDAALVLSEGESEIVLPEASPQAEESHLEGTTTEKPRMKPARFAIITILVLIALCCLMSIIVYFMVRPAMLESRPVGMLLLPVVKQLF